MTVVSPAPRLVRIDGREIPLEKDLIIGRSEECNIQIQDALISRQHARLLVQGNQVFIEDLNSTNSTYLNRQRLQPGQRYLVNSGDELRLGGVVLVYYSSQA